jgi:hypothetical protein
VQYLAVARNERAARDRTAVKSAHPPEELYAVEIHRELEPVPPNLWNPRMERCLGRLDEFSPRVRYQCRDCHGSGREKHLISAGDWEKVACSACKGTGVRLRRPKG